MNYKYMFIFCFLFIRSVFAVAQSSDRLRTQQGLQQGVPAPDIILNGTFLRSLDSIRAEKTLVVFWSSLCSHCRHSMPRLKKLYDSMGPVVLEIVAVSVDTSLKAWTTAIQQNGYKWLNYCDGKGWYSLPALNYGVSQLPTMYLLDNRKRIISRPESLDDLEKLLSPKQDDSTECTVRYSTK
jgi:thiol-disulfide isomerase/thioredoxin